MGTERGRRDTSEGKEMERDRHRKGDKEAGAQRETERDDRERRKTDREAERDNTETVGRDSDQFGQPWHAALAP
eukprot:11138758-Lingulodinium_polyedra.AAC.1